MNEALCRRLEWIERQAMVDLVAAVPPDRAEALGLEAAAHGGAIALRCGAFDTLLFNRVIGLGVDAPADRGHLPALLHGYRQHFFVHLLPTAEPVGLSRWLTEAGLVRYRRAWNKLARTTAEPPPQLRTELQVRPARADEALAVGAILADAFDLPPAGAEIFASVVGRPRWHTLVACDGDLIASTGLLYVEGGVGYLAGGATRPGQRCRGGQGAVMAARVRRALELGCRVVASETGAPAPGDPQHSHRNMERCGLAVVATRDNYASVGATWEHGARRAPPSARDSDHEAGGARRSLARNRRADRSAH